MLWSESLTWHCKPFLLLENPVFFQKRVHTDGTQQKSRYPYVPQKIDECFLKHLFTNCIRVYMSNTNKKEKKSMLILYLLFSALALALAASRWGTNSGDGIDSCEWQRRQDWPGFHEN